MNLELQTFQPKILQEALRIPDETMENETGNFLTSQRGKKR
jgi:hypothetical protein